MLYDLIVIGSGPAGQRAALEGAAAGKKVAMIEQSPRVGGGCAHVATLPSKSFRESVRRWANSDKRGEKSKPPSMAELLKRRDRVVEIEAKTVEATLREKGISVYQGHARLVSPNDVEVESEKGKEKLTASFIVLAVGVRPVAPTHLRVDGKTVHDSDSILGLKKIPKELVVLGAGIIGCEYASYFATAGSKVYLVDRRHEILAAVDREIVKHLEERFAAQQIEIILEAECRKIEGRGKVTLSNGRKIAADAVLIAQGRRGNTEGLGLESIGIECDERGLVFVDDSFRTAIPSVYAVGDVVGPPALASTSAEEGRIACHHAFAIEKSKLPALFPYGVYTLPEISMVGLTEEDLRARKIDYLVGRSTFAQLARGQIEGGQWGLLKLLVCPRTLKILGVHIVGEGAADLIHLGQAVMALGGDVNYLVHAVFNYPTLSEAYKTAASHAVNQSQR